MSPLEKSSLENSQSPLQRKTTLKWGNDGELSAVDMARILKKLGNAELVECDLTCEVED